VTAWTAFAAVTGLVLVVVLALARSTAAAVDTSPDEKRTTTATASGEEASPTVGAPNVSRPPSPNSDTPGESIDSVADEHGEVEARQQQIEEPATGGSVSLSEVPTPLILANVVGSHGVLGALVLGAAVVAGVPWEALGVTSASWNTGLPAIGVGLLLGVGLYVADEAIAATLETLGIDHSETLREALTPEAGRDWLLLLFVVLPIVAGFEELLFRAALIGAIPAGFSVPPAVMVVVSTTVFALGHGLQGPGGILVTGLLGGVLGVAFLLSGSLLLVFVAHYVVNAIEFLVHEYFEIELIG
jgi:membrane protease YdiL (CAAX protease family)